MPKNITRRSAIKTMVAGGAGIIAANSILNSCAGKPKQKQSTYVPVEKTSGTIVTRDWEGIGTVSLLGLGCMRFPRVEGEKNVIDQAQVNEMVDYALAHGINYFDTAPAYGPSETATGIALSRYPRESYYIATKMSNRSGDTVEQAQAMFENSLKCLQTEYVDFMLLHGTSGDDFNARFKDNGVLDYLYQMKEEGKIRHIGFSFHGSNDAFAGLLALPYKWDFVQIQMNYFDWKDMPLWGSEDLKCDAETLYTMLAERNIPAVIMEPIRGGALANVNDSIRERFEAVRPDLSPAGMALSFVASFPGVMCVLSGMSNMDQMKENIDTFRDFVPLTKADNEMLFDVARLMKENTLIGCTGCSYCMPCPNGVNIPGNFKVYDTCSNELNLPVPEGEHNKEYKQKRKIFLNRYNKGLQDSEKADMCVGCNVCVSKCPQHIRIPQQLSRIADLVKQLDA